MSIALKAMFAVAFLCTANSNLVSQEPTKPVEPGHSVANATDHTNALAKETSPYLLMHAHNPVDWHAWNEATLELAKRENKPIFLSVGYSSCHWCHVMERESFLDEEIAKYLNAHFICIKVDREERPDVDEIYMEALHVFNQLSGSNRGGGWPLSMFLLPDGRPFFGGTYYPARTGDRGRSVGFLTIITTLNDLLESSREQVESDAAVITRVTKESLAGRDPTPGMEIQHSWISQTIEGLSETFDHEYGGFGFRATNPNMTKFPEPSNLLFLLEQTRQQPDNPLPKKLWLTTLERMAMGGIYDHLGGGFHRYSVDRFWRIPHYEKMLYDNGQLASVYAEAFEITSQPEFRSIVEGILDFVSRELTAENGGFYASLDAESEGEEGKFYVWKSEEIKAILSEDEYKLFASIYGLNEPPNFEGKFYAPQLSQPLAEHASRLGITYEELETRLDPLRKKLFVVRSQRIRPLLDHKILTSWNGMMIRGYADAGRILKKENYIATAERAAKFALENLRSADGRLFRTFTDETAKLNAYLVDYACLIDGLIALHRATGEQSWLDAADALQHVQNELFWDEKNGGYFYTSSDHETLLARSKKPMDNAVPAGNSVAAGNLIYLAKSLNNDDYRERARRTVISASPIIRQFPTATPRLMITADQLLRE